MQVSPTSYCGVLVIVLALITYGSLYPLSISLEAANAAAWKHFFTTWGGKASIGDVVGNIALFVPLGFFATPSREEHGVRSVRFIAIVVCGTLFALVLQLIQLAIPVRDAALVDVVWNAVGLGTGLALGSATVTTRWLGSITDQPVPHATLIVAALWGASELVPLVPSIDPQLIKDSLKPLFLEPRFTLLESLSAAVGIGVLGQTLARIMPERASLAWLLLAALLVLAAKPFIVAAQLDVSTVAGFGLGCMVWAGLLRFGERQRATALLAGVFFVLTATSLEPFQLDHSLNPMSWIPFAEVLKGSMLVNARSLVSSLFMFTAILWLVRLRGGSLLSASLLLALWVALLETAQMFIVGRTPSITKPLWVLLVAFTLDRLSDTARPADMQRDLASRAIDSETAAPASPSRTRTWWRVLSLFAVTAAIGAIALWVVVRLPGVPYNMRELLHGDSNLLAAWVFVLAVLWIGAGAAWMANQLHTSPWPIFRIPLIAFATAMVSLLLLSLSVTQESILDIAGSNNLHWFVTNRDIWGGHARALFLAIGPEVVAVLERAVRYAALYAPVVIIIAIAQAARLQSSDRARVVATRVGWLVLNALPWLVLCKAIVFDWSSTDNLNELIAQQGLSGVNGDYFIYALIAVLAVNAVLIAQVRSLHTALIALVVTIIVVPIGWWLVNQALADQVQKYGYTFSGLQFLLGPNRSDMLSTEALLARWVAVQMSGVAVFAFGLRLMAPVFGPGASSEKPSRVGIKSQARANAGITVRLHERQVDYLDGIADQLGIDFQSMLQRVVDSVLHEYPDSTLVDRLSRPTIYRADDSSQRVIEQRIVLPESQEQRINGLAARAGISPSRTIRRAVQLYMEHNARQT